VLERAKLAVDNQYQELITLELSEKTRTLHFATQHIFSNLVGKVSHFDLRKINDEVIKCKSATNNSICLYRRIMVDSMGLPCSHVIQQIGNQPSLQTQLNSFWWVSGTNNVSPIVHVPPNDISATLTALNIQFQEDSVPYPPQI
jgi:hypothetical protein